MPIPTFELTGSISGPLTGASSAGSTLFRVASNSSGQRHLLRIAADDSEAAVRALHAALDLRAAFDAAWATVPIELVDYAGRPALVMTDPGGTLLSAYQGVRHSVSEFLRIAASLGTVLDRLHTSGLVHGGLTPDSFLIADDFRQAALCGIGASQSRDSTMTSAIGEEHLPYAAPERIAGLTDAASPLADLYSLGCILRELLTNQPVFVATDVLAWSHAHVARTVPSVRKVRADVPPCVDDLLLRLLAKNASDRHPSASALLADIAACVAMLNEGSGDETRGWRQTRRGPKQDRFSGLVGMRKPLALLDDSLAAVARGELSRCVFISGDSGAGKTSLVRHFLSAHAHSAALIATSKATVSEQNTPFGMVIGILKSLLSGVMATPGDEFASWRMLISDRLADNLPSLRKIVPEFNAFMEKERIGTAPLTANEHHALLSSIVEFIRVVALRERPVILFFDDLQWADTYSREIIRLLAHAPEAHGILTIGTFRSSHADEFLKSAIAGDADLHVQLRPLTLDDLQGLVKTRYRCSDDDAHRISRLLHRKTDGNPFFAKQLLLDLEHDQLISAPADTQSFYCDFDAVVQRTLTDDVLAHLRRRISSFDLDTRKLMQLIACVGVRVPMEVLEAMTGCTGRQVQERLEPAIHQECVHLDRSGGCSFLHDRICEAVYEDIEVSDRTSMHYQIGIRLFESLRSDSPDEALFQAVTQINRARSLVDDRHRQKVVELNLEAAAKARSMTAYRAALNYLEVAGSLSTAAADDDVTVRRTLLKAECLFLCNAPDVARHLLVTLLKLDIALPLRAEATRILIPVYTSLNLVQEAVSSGLAFLEHVAIRVPIRPADADVDHAYRDFCSEVHGRRPADLTMLPFADDPVAIAATDVIAELIPPALFSDVNLMDLLVLRMAQVSLRSGHTDASCYGYVCLMFVIGMRYGDLVQGYAFGELGISLCEERRKYRARSLMGFGMFVLPWQRPVRGGARFLRAALDAAKADGDLTFAVYCGRNTVSNMLASGMPLDVVAEEAQRALALAQATEFHLVIDALGSQLGLIEALSGATTIGTTSGDQADQAEISVDYPMPRTKGSIAEFCFWTHRMQACVIFGDTRGALAARQGAAPIAWSSRAFNEIVDFRFFGALAAMLAAQERPEDKPNPALATEIHSDVQQLEQWAAQCPENFLGRVALLAAQRAINDDASSDTIIAAFEHAVEHAHLQGFVQDEALAHELAARYFARTGSRSLAKQYLANARDCYARWGASAKVRLLDADPLMNRWSVGKAAGSANSTQMLDALAMIKASNALSSEIMQAKVIRTIMATALESGGAQRGTLLIANAGGLKTAAEATVAQDEIQVVLDDQSVEFAALPMSVVNAVSRSQRSISLDNAVQDFTFGKDPYFQRKPVCSVFCLPLIKQTKLISVLYLENRLIAGAFIPSRTAVLEVLASQAAIALENARLYEELVIENRERAKTEAKLRTVQADLEHASRLSTMGELVASIVHEVSQPVGSVGMSAAAAIRWLNRDVPQFDEALAMLRQIGEDSARAKAVIQGLRSLSKKSMPTKLPFVLHDAIDDVLSLVRVRASHADVDIARRFAADIQMVTGDRVQIQQVLLNLLMNAFDATSASNERKAAIAVTTTFVAEGWCEISVADSGIGFDQDTTTRLFDAFYTTKPDGMGMGLPICRSIVEAHGGRLTAEHNPGGGAIMKFTIPLDRQPGDR